MNIILYVLIVIETIALTHMIIEFAKVLQKAIRKKINRVMNRCVHDKDYRNDIASCLFFFQDMGPNISSFSIIALLISSEENNCALLIVFFVGIMVKRISRRMKNSFYADIEKRK